MRPSVRNIQMSTVFVSWIINIHNCLHGVCTHENGLVVMCADALLFDSLNALIVLFVFIYSYYTMGKQ